MVEQLHPSSRLNSLFIVTLNWEFVFRFKDWLSQGLTVAATTSNSAPAMRTYDLAMTHKLDADDFFIHRVQQHCAERRLNFFLIDPVWVETFYEKLLNGKVWPRVLINMHSEHHQPDDIFHRLVRLAFDRKTRVIDPPDIAAPAFDKACLHPKLLEAGLNLPHTVIVPQKLAANFDLSEQDRARLGDRFVIKPAMGYGKRGVLLEASGPVDIARSQREWPDAHYLLQERIVPRDLDGRPAYFRVFFVFGSIWFAWWNCYTDQYGSMTKFEMEKYLLHPLGEIVCRLAALTRMNFFSSEIALDERGEFVLIDYVNDQCHMLTQSSNPAIGVPDEIVAGIARKLVDGAQQLLAKSP